MSILHGHIHSANSSNATPFPFAIREDLIAQDQSFHGSRHWIIKDPLTLKYTRLSDTDYYLLTQFDGKASLHSIKEKFETRFPELSMNCTEIKQFAYRALKQEFLISHRTLKEMGCAERISLKEDQFTTGRFLNFLFPRIRLFDPDALLTWIHRHLKWCLNRWLLVFCMGVMAVAFALVISQFQEFQARLLSSHSFLDTANVILACTVLVGMKLMHELGHGLMCKHFGGECHEIGFMLLGITPCLYCDVSNSVLFENKWHRIAVGVAGIIVDSSLAAVATLLWWTTREGEFNAICMNVMIIGSFGTIIFNANPLLRFDGYYILSDLIEVPNLFTRSRKLLFRACTNFYSRSKESDDFRLPNLWQKTLILYALLSMCYRTCVLLGFLWYLHFILKPFGLSCLVIFLVVGLTTGAFIQVVRGAILFLPWSHIVIYPRSRTIFIAAAFLLLAILLVIVPLPSHVHCEAESSFASLSPIYVPYPGILEKTYCTPGEHVKEGQVLAKLHNDQIDMTNLEIQGKIDQLQVSIENRPIPKQNSRSEQLQEILEKSQLDTSKQQFSKTIAKAEALLIKAPLGGRLIHPTRQKCLNKEQRRLPSWSGFPLEQKNQGAYINAGTLVCYIESKYSREIIAWVKQEDRSLVQPGQRVTLRFNQFANKVVKAEVKSISNSPIHSKLMAQQSNASVALRSKNKNTEIEQYYQAILIATDEKATAELCYGVTGAARIKIQQQSLGEKAIRWIRQTYREPF